MDEQKFSYSTIKEFLKDFGHLETPINAFKGLIWLFIIFLIFLGLIIKEMPPGNNAIYVVVVAVILAFLALLFVIKKYITIIEIRTKKAKISKEQFQDIINEWDTHSTLEGQSDISDDKEKIQNKNKKE